MVIFEFWGSFIFILRRICELASGSWHQVSIDDDRRMLEGCSLLHDAPSPPTRLAPLVLLRLRRLDPRDGLRRGPRPKQLGRDVHDHEDDGEDAKPDDERVAARVLDPGQVGVVPARDAVDAEAFALARRHALAGANVARRHEEGPRGERRVLERGEGVRAGGERGLDLCAMDQ